MKIKIGSPKKWANRGRHFFVKQPLQKLIIVGVIALVGGFAVYHSFALSATDAPSDAGSLVLELDKGQGAQSQFIGDQFNIPQPIAFRLYGNGLAICGNPASQTINQPYYLSTTLSQNQVDALVNRIKQAGFLNLNQQYYKYVSRMDAIADTITLNLNANSYNVTYFNDGGPKPAAYQAAESAIEFLCAGVNRPYNPSSVVVETKQVNSSLNQTIQTNGISNTDLPDIKAPVTQKTLRGNQATQAFKDAAGNIQKVYKQGDKLYQSVVIPQLPGAHQSPAKHLKISKAGENTVYADGNQPIQFAVFCPTDSCLLTDKIDTYRIAVQDFYAIQLNKMFSTPAVTIIHGAHPSSYYRACQPSRPCSASALQNIYQNIYSDYSGFPFVRTELLLGFTAYTSQPTFTGEVGIGGLPGNLSITAQNVYSSGGASEFLFDKGAETTMAHELGHNFRLGHDTGSDEASNIMAPSLDCTMPLCALNNVQKFSIIAYNQNYFHAIPPGTILVQLTTVKGRVALGTQGLAGVKINTCTSQSPTTDANGNFSFQVIVGTGFCVRLGSNPINSTWPVLGTNNNSDVGGYKTKSYEWQVAGADCWHVCSGSPYYWDLAPGNTFATTDTGYNFNFSGAISVWYANSKGYILDSWGKLHPLGSAPNPPLLPNPSTFQGGHSYARGMDLNSQLQGYILSNTGISLPVNQSYSGVGPQFSFDIARDFKLIPDSAYTGGNTAFKGYVLDGWGGIHSVNGAPGVSGGPYWQGWDIARKMVVRGDGTGGYVLDGYGGLHTFRIGAGATPPVAHVTGYWNGWDIARSVVLKPDGTGGYVLDGWGGIHPFSTGSSAAPPAPKSFAYWKGWDIARDMVVTDWTNFKGYTLDGWGGLHPFSP